MSSATPTKPMPVWMRDEELDEMYASLFRELLTYMMEDPRNIGPATHLLFMAKNIERIGDHATNIAEDLYYLVHGTPLAQKRPKGDRPSLVAMQPGREPGVTQTARPDRRGRGAARHAAALQPRKGRLRRRRGGRRRGGAGPHRRAQARHRTARLDAAARLRHRGVPADPAHAADPRACRSSC